MRSRPVCLCALLLASPAARADPLEPTAYACTVSTLVTDQPCTFEGLEAEASDAQTTRARQNRAAVEAVARAGCSDVAKLGSMRQTDQRVRQTCVRQLFDVAGETCALDGAEPLLDAEGRFLARAADCYQVLTHVMSSLRTSTAMLGSCCDCLFMACGVPAPACRASSAAGSTQLGSCAARACAWECGLPPTANPEPKVPRTETPQLLYP